MALLILVLLGFANLVLQARAVAPGPRQRRSLIDPDAFHDWPFLLFVAGCFTVFLGLYTPFVHVQSYALEKNIVSPKVALYILAILNASSIFGRILPSFVAQRLGPMNMIIGTSCALGVTSLCLITAKTFSRLIATIVVQGFFTGTFFALQPTIFVRLTADPRNIGTRFGMAFCVMSFALLFGPPISGALRTDKGYDAAWIWAGITVLAGGTLIATARIIKGCGIRKRGHGILPAKIDGEIQLRSRCLSVTQCTTGNAGDGAVGAGLKPRAGAMARLDALDGIFKIDRNTHVASYQLRRG